MVEGFFRAGALGDQLWHPNGALVAAIAVIIILGLEQLHFGHAPLTQSSDRG